MVSNWLAEKIMEVERPCEKKYGACYNFPP